MSTVNLVFRMLSCGSSLYPIIDAVLCRKHKVLPVTLAQILLDAGIPVFQYRDKISDKNTLYKTAEQMNKMAIRYSSVFILNDFATMAAQLGCMVHLGQDDISNGNPQTSFGLSTHNKEEIERALSLLPRPEYIGFGAVFSSQTKKDVGVRQISLQDVLQLWPGAIVFIGGITLDNVKSLPAGFHHYFAVISDLFRFGEKPKDLQKYVHSFQNLIIRNNS